MSYSPRIYPSADRYREPKSEQDSENDEAGEGVAFRTRRESDYSVDSIFERADLSLVDPQGDYPPEVVSEAIDVDEMVQQNAGPSSAGATQGAATAPSTTARGASASGNGGSTSTGTAQVLVAPVVAATNQNRQGTASDLPVKGSREAPSTFKGRFTEIEDFVEHYEKLLTKYNITSDKDRCEGILGYCSSSVKGVIRCAEDYQTPNWGKLKQYLMKLYDAERARQRYLPHDVYRFSQKSALRPITDLTDWLVYCRRYQERAGSLHKAKKISETDYRMHFWHGIPVPLRNQLEDRLWRAHPKHDIQEYFPITQVSAQAEQLFHRNKFTTLHAQTPTYDLDDSEGELSDDESSSSSDSDSSLSSYGKRHRQKRRRKEKRKKRRKQKDRDEERVNRLENVKLETREHVTKPQGTADEVQDIIRQLGAMRVDDSTYPALYYRALQLDSSGAVEKCVRPYAGDSIGVATTVVPTGAAAPAVPYVAPVAPNNFPSTPFPARRAPPPFASGRNAPPFGMRNNNMNPRSFEARMDPSDECFGCGIPGHKMHECGVIQQKLQLGEIVREPSTNRITMADGEWIRRNGNESLATAVDRILENRRPTTAGKSLFVTLKENVQSYLTRQEADNEEGVGSVMETENEDDEIEEGNEWEDEYWNERMQFEHEEGSGDQELYSGESESEASLQEDPEEEESDSSNRTLLAGSLRRVYTADQSPSKGKEVRRKISESPREAERPKRVIRPPIRADGTRVPGIGRSLKTPVEGGLSNEQPGTKRRESAPSPEPVKREDTLPSARGDLAPVGPKNEITVKEVEKTALRRKSSVEPDVEMLDASPLKLKPVSARGVRFREPVVEQPKRDDSRKPVPVETRRRPSTEKPISIENPYSRRTSEISTRVNKAEVLRRILDAPVTMPIREVLGSSGDLCRGLLDMIKLRNPSASQHPQVMTVKQHTNRDVLEQILRSWLGQQRHAAGNGQLIRIPMINNGYAFEGILDTGSELNVVSSKLSELGITPSPIDITQGTRMSDANGGEGRLTGVIEDVTMKIGSLRLRGDFFVGDQVPFDALLGRPWQTKNRVSIDERPKGTYLVFKDEGYKVTHEMLAVPAPHLREFIASRAQQQSLYMTQRRQPQDHAKETSSEGSRGGNFINSTENKERHGDAPSDILESLERTPSCARTVGNQELNSEMKNANWQSCIPENPGIDKVEEEAIQSDESEEKEEDTKGVAGVIEAGLILARLLLNVVELIRVCLERLAIDPGTRKGNSFSEYKRSTVDEKHAPNPAPESLPKRISSEQNHRPLNRPLPTSAPTLMDSSHPSPPPDDPVSGTGSSYVDGYSPIPPQVSFHAGLLRAAEICRNFHQNHQADSKTATPPKIMCLGSPSTLAGQPYELQTGQVVQDFYLLDLVATVSPSNVSVSQNTMTGFGKLTLQLDGPNGDRDPALQVPPASALDLSAVARAAFPRATILDALAARIADMRDEDPDRFPRFTTSLLTIPTRPLPASPPPKPSSEDGSEESEKDELEEDETDIAMSVDRDSASAERGTEQSHETENLVNEIVLVPPASSLTTLGFAVEQSSGDLADDDEDELSYPSEWDDANLDELAADLGDIIGNALRRPESPIEIQSVPISLLLRQITTSATPAGSTIRSLPSPPPPGTDTSAITIASPVVAPSPLAAAGPTILRMLHSEPQKTVQLLSLYPASESQLVDEVRLFQRANARLASEKEAIEEESEESHGETGKRKYTLPGAPGLKHPPAEFVGLTRMVDPLTQRPSRLPANYPSSESATLSSAPEEDSSQWTSVGASDDAMSIASSTPEWRFPQPPTGESLSRSSQSTGSTTDDDMPALEPINQEHSSIPVCIEIEDLDAEGSECQCEVDATESAAASGQRVRVVLTGEEAMLVALERSRTPALEERRAVPRNESDHPLPTPSTTPSRTFIEARFEVDTDGRVRPLPAVATVAQPPPLPLTAPRPMRDFSVYTEAEARALRDALSKPGSQLGKAWRNIPVGMVACGLDLLPAGDRNDFYIHSLRVLRCTQKACSFISLPSVNHPSPLMAVVPEHIGYFSEQLPRIVWAILAHRYVSHAIQAVKYPAASMEKYICVRHDDPQLAPTLSPRVAPNVIGHYERQHCFPKANPLDAGIWFNQVLHLKVLRRFIEGTQDDFGEFLTLMGLQEVFRVQYEEMGQARFPQRYCPLMTAAEHKWFLTFIKLMHQYREPTMAGIAEKVLTRHFEEAQRLEYLLDNHHISPRDPATFPCVEPFSHEDYCAKKGLNMTVHHYSKELSESKGHFILDEPQPMHSPVYQGYSFGQTTSTDAGTREDFSSLLRHLFPGLLVPTNRTIPVPSISDSSPRIKMFMPPNSDSFMNDEYTYRLSAYFGGIYFKAPDAYRPWIDRAISIGPHRTTPRGRPPPTSNTHVPARAVPASEANTAPNHDQSERSRR